MGDYATPISSAGLNASPKRQSTKHMAASVEYPFLARLEPESIRVFLRRYEAYCREVQARAAQVAGEDSPKEEPGRPVGLVFCVDADHSSPQSTAA